ncbi:lipolytic enzyme, G-D-S-L [Calothrix sp. NIES-4071]|nr:lipolytic enzyme, G-D-S-L [Calothrix sp. NIES-4071]BAZ57461.1 lipolytic enzyme, G-D-S-L [Calothrix sp. NIES-4105]
MQHVSTSAKSFPIWAFFSLLTNGVLVLAVILLFLRQQGMTALFRRATPASQNIEALPTKTPQLGTRHQLSYSQWLDILKREAEVAASKRPQRLTILVGDSLSLWFPTELLPEERSWLNQGISGETSTGLLKRLNLFDRTQPETIFVMIGINDLIRSVDDAKILDNYRRIIATLRASHPKSQIVIQSILPHGASEATWEGKQKLLAIPNSRIRELNQQLQNIATKEGINYLDLHPLFANSQGNLRPDFSTDGLHLSQQGYLVWRSALQLYSEMELKVESGG